MKSGNRIVAATALAACGAFLLRAELPRWAQHTEIGPVFVALFRNAAMPGGPVSILRPPAEARPALTRLIASTSDSAALYRLRAQEAELALDFPAAEGDWKAYVAHAHDRYAADLELADFYQRRGRPSDEITALMAAAKGSDDPLLPATAQRGWHAFERMAATVREDSLPAMVADPVWRAWVARYPKEPLAWRALIGHLSAVHQYAAAEAEIVAYERNFHDDLEPVRLRAELELQRGNASAALAIYDRAFRPLWPSEIRASYFQLLADRGKLRDFSGRARAAVAANPADLDATARLFHYYRSQNNPVAARRALLEFRLAKESGRSPWTPDELATAAQLFEWLPDVNEAARLYYALYSAPASGAAQQEQALAGLANLLLTASDQPIQFGSGDLSFYKDIAAVDPSPSFLNGILSLILNGSGIRWEYRNQNAKSAAYFHRAAGVRLVALLDQRYPRSTRRDPLHAAVVAAYAAYGDDVSVIRAGREYLTGFPHGESRTPVALQVSDALARTGRLDEELALYDQLLRELAGEAGNVPIGSVPPPPAAQPPTESPAAAVRSFQTRVRPPGAPVAAPQSTGARSEAYAQVLDKYLARLAAVHRPLDALRVYRAEIDRNPNDPGLYQRFAAYLEQNNMSRDLEELYGKAIAKFPDPGWYDKLARWYLRTRQSRELEALSRRVIAVFSGADLERYFGEIVSATHPDAALYRQLNLYAHDRFPEDLVFVRNLLGAYQRPESRDAAAADRLLRQYWFYDAGLRDRFFERLSQQGGLSAELTQIRSANPGIVNGAFDQALAANPAAVQFHAEAEAWLSHFEAAAPAIRALAKAYSGEREFTAKGASIYRSLAAYDPLHTETALSLAGLEERAEPRNTEILATMGDILADRNLMTRARAYWDRMPLVQPGRPEAYLDAATVFWDYYRYDDALRLISAARRKFAKPALFAYQAGAIDENKRDYAAAVRQYVAGAIDGDQPSHSRLLRLATRPATRDAVDRATAAAVAANPTPEAVSLRIDILASRRRRPEIESLLAARVEAERSPIQLAQLQESARHYGFDRIEERADERLISVGADPVDQMRLTLARARLLESKKDIAGAAVVVDALYRQRPLILGVVRGAADFHVRNHQPAPAIDILLDAARDARAELGQQFTLEAARIATSAGQFDRARTLLSGLLAADPLRADAVTAMADTYLQAHDDHGFRDFELATVERLKASSLTPAERVARIASIRRALIPALDRLHDQAGAADQYIAILNAFPEDESLAKEAAVYALAHGQETRLLAFYRKTIADAPRDYRWPIVLARIETAAEDYPAAIADYGRALSNRPDRADVLEAKARLEERLMRFADAVTSYTRLYDLTYRDPQWMVRVAEMRARSGQNAEAVAALRTAIIGARTETADADFSIAESLESWHILPDAVSFAERGAALAGPDLFQSAGNAVIYARILARARRLEPVLALAVKNPGADRIVAQAIGRIVSETYTPDEKLRLQEQLLERGSSLLPIAEAAGLLELEARWRSENMTPAGVEIDPQLSALEARRGVYGDWGRQLETYAAANPGKPVEAAALIQAAQAFRSEGDPESEQRVLRRALARNALGGPLLDRYLQLLLARQPDALPVLARSGASDEIRNRAAQMAIASDRAELAYAALRARGASLPPVWTNAFTALTGRYLDDRSSPIDAAFQTVLDTRAIGDRLATPRKPDAAILGHVWFYYAARYGEYLGGVGGESWLPAGVEAAPQNADAYMALGDWYAAHRDSGRALARYGQALELDSDRGDALDHAARLLWSEGRHDEAVARWKSAIATFIAIQTRGVRVPESFWSRVAQTFADIGGARAVADMRSDMARLLAGYEGINGEYRFFDLLLPAARASLVSGQGVEWLMDLARSAQNPEWVTQSLLQLRELTPAQRIGIQRELVSLIEARANSLAGDDSQFAAGEVVNARLRLISLLLDAGDVAAATAEWRNLPPAGARSRWARFDQRDIVEVRLAVGSGTLAALLDRYRAEPEAAPGAESLRQIAAALRNENQDAAARALLAFTYDRELREGRLDASNFLGLAEVRLQENDTAAALALLNRMALVLPDGFDTLPRAAELLAQAGKSAEAAGFLRRRMQAAPWDSEARVQLARLLPAGAERDRLLAAAVDDSQAPYRVRADAARIAGKPLGTTDNPLDVEARLDAAESAAEPQARLRLFREALAIAPADPRARLGALRAAIATRRDALALSIEQAAPQGEVTQLTPAERAGIAESLAVAAERLDELPTAEQYLRAAIALVPPDARPPIEARLKALTAEQNRRTQNAARQPVVKNVVEQDHIVGPRLARSAQ